MRIRLSGGKITEYTKDNYHVYAKGDITFTAKKVIQEAPEIIFGKADPHPEQEETTGTTLVELRPLVNMESTTASKVKIAGKEYEVYNGQFGFDWYQQHEVIPWVSHTPVQIESLLQNGIKSIDAQGNTTPYSGQEEALQAYRNTYKQLGLGRKYKTEKYYIPYLALFDEETSRKQDEKMKGKDGYVSPPFRAAFNLYIDVAGKKPEKILVSKNPYFDTNWKEYNERYNSVDFSSLAFTPYYEGLVSNVVLELSCKKSFSEPQKISLWALYAGNPVPQLAGRVIALPNSEAYIQRQKIVLVDTKMDINNTKIDEKFQNGQFQPSNIRYLYYLHQFLLLPEWELLRKNQALDLTHNPDFKTGGYCIDDKTVDKEIRKEDGGVHERLYRALAEAKNDNGKPKYSLYPEGEAVYFFALGLDCNGKQTKGSTHPKNKWVLMFKIQLDSNFPANTPSHECLHALGLAHTFINKKDGMYGSQTGKAESLYRLNPNKKFVFKPNTTLNLMDYSPTPYTSFYWQWKIINPAIEI